MNCSSDNLLTYCWFNNVLYIGTNSSEDENAIVNKQNLPANLTLPSKYQGNPIEVIGFHAFSGCEKITELRLGRYVKIIEDSAFRCAYSLRKIIIPPSVTFVGNYSIRTAFGNSSSNFGTLDVFFEPNSRLNYVGKYGISGAKYINIYYCSCRIPDVIANNFYYPGDTVKVFSSISFNFGRISTIKKVTGMCNIHPFYEGFNCNCVSIYRSYSINSYLTKIIILFLVK